MSSSTIPTDLLVPTAEAYCERGGFHRSPPSGRTGDHHRPHRPYPPGCDQYVCCKRTADLIRSRYGPDQNCLRSVGHAASVRRGDGQFASRRTHHGLRAGSHRGGSMVGRSGWSPETAKTMTTPPLKRLNRCRVTSSSLKARSGSRSTLARPETVLSQINDWWATNAAQEPPVVMTYAVGKASACWPGLIRTLDQSVSMVRWLDPPRCTAAGIKLPKTIRAGRETATELQAKASSCVHPPPLGPPGFEGSPAKMAWKQHLLRVDGGSRSPTLAGWIVDSF